MRLLSLNLRRRYLCSQGRCLGKESLQELDSQQDNQTERRHDAGRRSSPLRPTTAWQQPVESTSCGKHHRQIGPNAATHSSCGKPWTAKLRTALIDRELSSKYQTALSCLRYLGLLLVPVAPIQTSTLSIFLHRCLNSYCEIRVPRYIKRLLSVLSSRPPSLC